MIPQAARGICHLLLRAAGLDCGVEARELARGCSKAIVKWMDATFDERWIRLSALAVSKFLTKSS